MNPDRLRVLLAACLISVLAQSASGDEPALVLRQDTQLRGSAVAGPEGPLFISADRIESSQPDIIEAFGQVEARHAGQNFFADFLRYDTRLDQVYAKGNVRLEQEQAVVTGDSLTMKLDTKAGTMQKPTFDLTATPGRGRAERADFQDEDHASFKHALYTTCPVDDEAWKLQVTELDIDQAKQVGTAHGALLTFQNVPLLYTPWMNFSLDNSRKSGVLAPTFGTTSKSGLEISLPYYFNLAPNYDATLYTRLLSKRGLQVGGEGRYLMDTYQGTALLEALSDKTRSQARWAALLQHEQRIDPTLVGKIDFQRVSDNDYYRDLSTLIVKTSQTLLPQQGQLEFDDGSWQGQFLVQQFQLLQDPNNPITRPYGRMPAVSLKTDRLFGALEGKLDSEFDYFTHPTQTQGARLIVYPQLKLPWETSFASFNAKLGVHASYYNLDGSAPKQTITRVLPITSFDGGFAMDRDFNFSGKRYQQTLEPRAYYLYVPFRDQSQIPVFDTAKLDLSLDQMFRENQYIGGDRINDANQLTLALTSRLIDAENGLERLNLTFGQRYYFDKQQVTLPGETPRDTLSTDLLAAFGGQVTPEVRVDGTWQYNTDKGKTLRSNLSATYKPGPGRLLNVGYRLIAGSAEQMDLSSQWPLSRRLYGLTRINYSLKDRQLVEGLMGLEYNGGCWVLRSVIQRLATAQNSRNNAFFIQLELNGLGRLGSNPIDVLKQSIPGYASTTDIFSSQP